MPDREKMSLDRPMFGPDEELLTVKEVAQLVRLPWKSVYNLLGGIALELAPRTLRWRKSAVIAWIDSKGRGGLAA